MQRVASLALFLLVPVVSVAEQTPPPAAGTGLVEAYARERADGSASLLMVLEIANLGKVSEVRVETQDDDDAVAVLLPGEWRLSQDGKKIRLTGPPADVLRIRIDLRGDGQAIASKLTGKGLAIEGLNNGRTLFKTRVPVVAMAKVALIADVEGILTVPEEAVPGQPMLVTPADEFRQGAWEIRDGGEIYGLERLRDFPAAVKDLITPGSEPLAVTLPRFGDGTRVYYRDEWLEPLVDAPLGVKAAEAPTCARVLAGGAELAFAGQGACVSGCFPGIDSWYGLSLDGRQRLLVMSASPSRLVLWIPVDTPAGPHTIGWHDSNGDGVGGTVTLGVLQLEGAIDQNELWRGQSTTLRLRVVGTDRQLPLVVTNKTPGVISIQGGAAQTVQTPGGADNAVTRSVTGVRRGNFKIEYSLSQPGCGTPSGPSVQY